MTQTPLTILLIEDSLSDARLVQIALAEVGAGVARLIHVERLRDAGQRLQNEAIDIILLDLTLPDGQGVAALQTMQKLAPHIPIVVLTGRSDTESEAEMRAAGAHGYLAKGWYRGTELLRVLREVIEQTKKVGA